MTASDVFAHQTVEELAGFAPARPRASETADASARPAPLAPFALISEEDRRALPPDVTDAYPVTAMQLGMLVELRSAPTCTRIRTRPRT